MQCPGHPTLTTQTSTTQFGESGPHVCTTLCGFAQEAESHRVAPRIVHVVRACTHASSLRAAHLAALVSRSRVRLCVCALGHPCSERVRKEVFKGEEVKGAHRSGSEWAALAVIGYAVTTAILYVNDTNVLTGLLMGLAGAWIGESGGTACRCTARAVIGQTELAGQHE